MRLGEIFEDLQRKVDSLSKMAFDPYYKAYHSVPDFEGKVIVLSIVKKYRLESSSAKNIFMVFCLMCAKGIVSREELRFVQSYDIPILEALKEAGIADRDYIPYEKVKEAMSKLIATP